MMNQPRKALRSCQLRVGLPLKWGKRRTGTHQGGKTLQHHPSKCSDFCFAQIPVPSAF